VSNGLEFQIEGDPDPLPFKVKWGLVVEKAFVTLAKAEGYTKKNLGSSIKSGTETG
jgi:hypothetical protein